MKKLPQVIDPPAAAIEQVTKGEVEIQALLAVRNPRDPDEALARSVAEATSSQETAAECFYAIRKGGRLIEGPSVRLTEIAARQWGNLRAGSRIVEVGDTLVTAQGYTWDLETNYVVYQERQRRITDKHGRRYSDDVIVSTANAAASIAFREAVIKTIGKTRLDPIWTKCRTVAVGDERALGDRYDSAIAHFGKAGVDEQRILASLDRKSRHDVTADDLGKLLAIANGLRDGDLSIDTAFPKPEDPATAVPKAGKSTFGKKSKKGKNQITAPEATKSDPPIPEPTPEPANPKEGAQNDEAPPVSGDLPPDPDDLPAWDE